MSQSATHTYRYPYQLSRLLFPLSAFLFLALASCAYAPITTVSPPPHSEVVSAPTSVPTAHSELLPHPLYYLANGQVFRMERDGKTVTQITFEEINVTDYDVSLADRSVAFIANNQLILADSGGTNRRVIADSGPREENNPWIANPVFSPDGKTLAFSQNGLNFYDLSTGFTNLVIEDQFSEPASGSLQLPIETYAPVRYSPDGTKLLVAVGHWESPQTHAVYHHSTNTLVRYDEVQDYINCCSYYGGPEWSPDSSSFYGIASIHDTSYLFGELWRVNAGNGSLTRTLRAETGKVYLPKEPYLAPDGKLYFFFGSYKLDSGFWDAPTINLVRSAPDGVTDRTVLRNENFVLMDEALWAPDASLVIVSTSPAKNWNQNGGVLELYYTDGRKIPVWLAPMGHMMKWIP